MRRCLDCDVLMRSARVPAEAVPLSRVFGGQGLCKTCHGRRMRGFVPAADISEGFDEGQARSALEAWLSDRRRRIEKLEGARRRSIRNVPCHIDTRIYTL